MFQPLGIELDIKQDCMKMCGHDHIGIDPQILFLNTKVEAVSDDLAGCFLDEAGQPFRDGEGDVIQPHVGDDAIAFHTDIIRLAWGPSLNPSRVINGFFWMI